MQMMVDEQSESAGDSEEEMLMMVAASAGDSAHAGDSAADPWALPTLASVVHSAQSYMPTLDSLLSANA
ncbi:MAG: hypothetical protein ACKPKO_18380, partial [Candidatus Fonsibacter sp.]